MEALEIPSGAAAGLEVSFFCGTPEAWFAEV